MTIIVSKGGIGAARIRESGVPKEGYLQDYIAKNPESLPFEDIKENMKLLILGREFETGSGPIDVLAADDDGDIFVIETKLYRNADKRRVVAQVLDYGAALWRTYQQGDRFLSAVEDFLARQGSSLNDRLKAVFQFDDASSVPFRDAIRANIEGGNLRFVVLMDTLDERLKDLILFLNERSRFAIYAVEMRFYRHEGYEIVIPKLFGAEVQSSVALSRPVWSAETFFADARRRLTTKQVEAVEKLYRFCESTAEGIKWGTGKTRGSFNPRYTAFASKSIFIAYSNGNLEVSLKYLRDSGAPGELVDRFGEILREVSPSLPPEFLQHYTLIKDWHPRADHLVASLRTLVGSSPRQQT